MPRQVIGLALAFVSAVLTNVAYSFEHDAAAALPPLSPRRPFRSAEFLLRDRSWLIAFGTESAGWLMYVAALRLPLVTRQGSPFSRSRQRAGTSTGSRPASSSPSFSRSRG